jgi:hypothetical protein
MEHGLLKYIWIKILATVPLCFLSFTIEQYEIIYGIAFMVILDTILGSWVAIRFKRFQSRILGEMVRKVGKYGIAMTSVWVLATVSPSVFTWLFNGMGIFIMMTELLSNFEKLALLGMVLPTKLVAKLNKQYKDLLEGSDPEDVINRRDKYRV